MTNSKPDVSHSCDTKPPVVANRAVRARGPLRRRIVSKWERVSIWGIHQGWVDAHGENFRPNAMILNKIGVRCLRVGCVGYRKGRTANHCFVGLWVVLLLTENSVIQKLKLALREQKKK